MTNSWTQRPPVVLAYGIGVDSTALLVELESRGEAPDLVLAADTGVENPLTYEYLDLIRFQDVAASMPVAERPTVRSWIDRFNAAIPPSERPKLAA